MRAAPLLRSNAPLPFRRPHRRRNGRGGLSDALSMQAAEFSQLARMFEEEHCSLVLEGVEPQGVSLV